VQQHLISAYQDSHLYYVITILRLHAT